MLSGICFEFLLFLKHLGRQIILGFFAVIILNTSVLQNECFLSVIDYLIPQRIILKQTTPNNILFVKFACYLQVTFCWRNKALEMRDNNITIETILLLQWWRHFGNDTFYYLLNKNDSQSFQWNLCNFKVEQIRWNKKLVAWTNGEVILKRKKLGSESSFCLKLCKKLTFL